MMCNPRFISPSILSLLFWLTLCRVSTVVVVVVVAADCPNCPTCPTRAPTRSPECAACPPCQVATGIGCGCTDNCCSTCPAGTRCVPSYIRDSKDQLVLDSEGKPMKCGCKCISCECGFCDSQQRSCCNINGGGNNCNPNNSQQWQTDHMTDCDTTNGRWPQLAGQYGNVCSGVEYNLEAVPNGCGCQPSQDTPCTYDPNSLSATAPRSKEQCFVCSVEDLVQEDASCSDCITCLLESWVGPSNDCTQGNGNNNNNGGGGGGGSPDRRSLSSSSSEGKSESYWLSRLLGGGGGGGDNGGGGTNSDLVPCNQTSATAFQCVTDAIAAQDAAALNVCFQQKYAANEYVFDTDKRQACATRCTKVKTNDFRRVLEGWDALHAYKKGMDLENIPLWYMAAGSSEHNL